MAENDKRENKIAQEEIFDQFYDFGSVVSATGMTGLTPELPQSSEAMESYTKLMGIPKKP